MSRSSLDVGDRVQVLHLARHLERLVDELAEMVELVAREVAQVEPLDLLQEVDGVPPVGREREDDVEEADRRAPRLDQLEEREEGALPLPNH